MIQQRNEAYISETKQNEIARSRTLRKSIPTPSTDTKSERKKQTYSLDENFPYGTKRPTTTSLLF